jgi:hypothetical protein
MFYFLPDGPVLLYLSGDKGWSTISSVIKNKKKIISDNFIKFAV